MRTRVTLSGWMRRASRALVSAPRICDSVKEWDSTRADSASTSLHPATEWTRKLPHSIEPEPDAHYSDRLRPQFREKYLVPLHQASLFGNSGLIVLPDHQLAAESVYGRTTLDTLLPDLDLNARRIKKSGPFFSLLSLWDIRGGKNYYHWLHDALMNLCFVLDALPANTQFIVRPGLRPFHLDSLALLGISDGRLMVCEPHECFELETLYFAPPTLNSGSDLPAADEWFRERIFRALEITPQKERRLFISRRNARSRRVINEAEVVDLLRPYGFETCTPEVLSFAAQVALFAQAEMVIGINGAGMTNLLFAPRDSIALEIMEPSFLHDTFVFWTICEAVGHQYWSFWAESVPNPGERPDVYVPMEKLKRTLDSIFAEHSPAAPIPA